MYARTTPMSVADEGNSGKLKSDSDTEVAFGQCPGDGQAKLVALADRIELWPIEKLRPYERNPRTHSDDQVDQIAASMVEFGWTNPDSGRRECRYPRRPWPAPGGQEARAGRSACDPVRAPQRGAETGPPNRRQSACPAGGLG
jgi:hypothetical protein